MAAVIIIMEWLVRTQEDRAGLSYQEGLTTLSLKKKNAEKGLLVEVTKLCRRKRSSGLA